METPHPPAPDQNCKGFALALVAVFLLALAARLFYVHLLHERGLFFGLFLDSKYYALQAARIRAGLGVGDHPYLFSPLYPYFLALFTDASGELGVRSVQWVQSLAGCCTAMLTALAGRRVAGPAAGIVAGVIVALYGPFIHLDSLILVASLQTLLFTLALWLAIVAGESWRVWLVVGLALGGAAALRPTGLVVVVASLLLLVAHGRRWKPAAALLVAVAAVVVPFTARNLVQSGEWVLLSANGGVNFWVGNHTGSSGLYDLPAGTDFVHDPLSKLEAERGAGRPLTHREASRWWFSRAFDDIRAAPFEWSRRLIRKGFYFLHPEEIAQLGSGFHWYRERAWPLRLLPDARWLFILALSGAVVRRSFLASGVTWMICFLVPYTAGICLFFVTGRHRAPIMPAVIVLATGALVWLGRSMHSGLRLRISPTAGAALGVILLSAPISYALYDRKDAPFYVDEVTGMEERHRGMALFDDGRYLEAAESYREALAIADDPITRTNLGNALQAAGRADEAAVEYERALQANPGWALAWYNYGVLLMKLPERVAHADRAFEEAARLSPLMPGPLCKKGELYLRNGRSRDAIGLLERCIELAAGDRQKLQRARALLDAARVRAGEGNAAPIE